MEETLVCVMCDKIYNNRIQIPKVGLCDSCYNTLEEKLMGRLTNSIGDAALSSLENQ